MFLIVERDNNHTYGWNLDKIVELNLDEKIIRVVSESIYYEVWFESESAASYNYENLMKSISKKETVFRFTKENGYTDCSCRLSLS